MDKTIGADLESIGINENQDIHKNAKSYSSEIFRVKSRLLKNITMPQMSLKQMEIYKLLGEEFKSDNYQRFKTGMAHNTSQILRTKRYSFQNRKWIKSLKSHKLYYQWIGYFLAITCALTSVANVMVQKSKLSHIETHTLNFWIAALGTPLSLTLTIIFERVILPTNLFLRLLLLGHCVFASLMTSTYIISARLTTATLAALSWSAEVFIMFIFQYTFLQWIFPSIVTFVEGIGATCVILSTLIIPLAQLVKFKD